MKPSARDTPLYAFAFCVLAGCSPTVEGWQIEQVQKQCESRGGVYEISTFMRTSGTCRDGSWAFTKRPIQ